ncbi:MAG: HAMP domain-containing sensor histidine kinase [Tetrasphaera sp.]
MRPWRVFAALAVLAALTWGALAFAVTRPLPPPDVVAAHALQRRLEDTWGSAIGEGELAAYGRAAVVDATGRVLAAHDLDATSELAALRAGASALDLRVAGRGVGRLYLAPDTPARVAERGRTALWATGLALAAVLAGAALVLAWVERRMLRPFRTLEHFARRVAGGDLAVPLAMDRGNAFGAFSESFDLMRTELAAARERERVAQESKKELLAQLSHDIRSPLASITAATEVLALGEPATDRRRRLEQILAKCAQLDSLVTELFDASADELQALPVTVAEHSSGALEALIRLVDTDGRVARIDLPACLLGYDARRMQQILDNILANAAKYAGTPVVVTATFPAAGGMLRLAIADTGPGVAARELDLLTGRGIRGTNADGKPGRGLGLFIAAYLIERMGGDLACRPTDPQTGRGLTVDLTLPLA